MRLVVEIIRKMSGDPVRKSSRIRQKKEKEEVIRKEREKILKEQHKDKVVKEINDKPKVIEKHCKPIKVDDKKNRISKERKNKKKIKDVINIVDEKKKEKDIITEEVSNDNNKNAQIEIENEDNSESDSDRFLNNFDDDLWIKKNAKLAQIDKDLNSGKLPLYKVGQLKKLKKLIKMSIRSRPRNLKHNTDHDNGNTGIKLKLDKSCKDKISNVTSFNPVREKILNLKLTDDEIAEIGKRLNKVDKFSKVKPKKVEDDENLRKTLDEITKRKMGLKFWGYDNERLDYEKYGNIKLLENEKRIQFLGMEKIEEVRKNLESLDKESDTEKFYCFAKNKIDINEANKESSIAYLLKQVNVLEKLDDDEVSDIDEEEAFLGLKKEDYTVVNKYEAVDEFIDI